MRADEWLLCYPFGVQVAIYLTCSLGMLITVLGNLLVIVVASHFKALHTSINLLLLSLTLADFLLRLTVLPFSTIWSVESCCYFGDDFCRLHTFLDTLFCLTSIFHLCFIAIDWHCAICHPLLSFTKFTILACIYIGVEWSVPMAYTSVFLYTKVIEEGLGHVLPEVPCVGSCQLLFNKLWGWLNFPVLFFPCLTMIVLYVRIFTVANKQARLINNMNRSIGSQLHVGASKSERKAVKTLGVAVGVYLLCWLPFTTDTMVDSLRDFTTPPVLFDILIWFVYFNSACDLIYVFSYRWFRKAVKLVLTHGIFCSRTSTVDLQPGMTRSFTCTVENIFLPLAEGCGRRQAGAARGPDRGPGERRALPATSRRPPARAQPAVRGRPGRPAPLPRRGPASHASAVTAGRGGDGSGPVRPSLLCRRRPLRPLGAGSPGPGKGSGSSAGAPGVVAACLPVGRGRQGGVWPVAKGLPGEGSLSGRREAPQGSGPQRPVGPRWGRGRSPGVALAPGLGRAGREGGGRATVTGGVGRAGPRGGSSAVV
ncbi:LOW QUALITY PROTEIN: trace amine-associated receptor 5-like [Aegotheles albertisi]